MDCVASPVELLYLYREQWATYRLCSISCRATVALEGIVGNVQTVQHLLQTFCSSTGHSRKRIDCVASPVELLLRNSRKRIDCVASPVELQYSSSTGNSRKRVDQREQQETYRRCSISCRATVALQGIVGKVQTVQHLLQSYCYREQQETYRLCSISCRATVALQGIVGNVQTVQHLLQSCCSSTGNSRKRIDCVASPVELLALQGILCSISCGATVALQGIVYREQQQTHRLCSISSSTGNSRKRIDGVASPVELLQLYREQQGTYRLCSISCRATVSLQRIVGNVQTVQHLLQSYCSSTANSRERIDCVASPVDLLQLYREQQETYRQCSISCRATVALQGIEGNVQTVQHLLQSYCSSTGNSRKCIDCVASPVELLLQGTVGNVQTVQHLLQSYCSSTGNNRERIGCVASPVELLRNRKRIDCVASTGNSRKRIDCVASPVELLYLYREQWETVALQGIVGNVQTVQHLLQSYCRSTGNSRKRIDCVASPVELLQLYREQQETYRLCSISCRATVALQGIVGNVQTVQHLLQGYCSSTGNSRKRIDGVASPVELLQLYREQQETCRQCSISCRATVALQGIVGNVQTVQHLLQSYCSPTGISRKRIDSVASPVELSRKRIDCVASPVEPLQLYREQQTTYRLCSISCRANSRKRIDCAASPVELPQLYREQQETYRPCSISVELLQLYREQQETYRLCSDSPITSVSTLVVGHKILV